IKFTPNGGAVDVTLSRDGGMARWTVHDTGPGIPADAIQHVFERFYRVDESTTRTQPGTGIGLSLVKELAELHAGTLTVASHGEGTTFTITIPIRAAEAGVASAENAPSLATEFALTAEHASGRPGLDDDRAKDVPTLLVVDDSADLRSYIRD